MNANPRADQLWQRADTISENMNVFDFVKHFNKHCLNSTPFMCFRSHLMAILTNTIKVLKA